MYRKIKKMRLWLQPKAFEVSSNNISIKINIVIFKIHRNPNQLTIPKYPFSRGRLYKIGSLREDCILEIEKKQREHISNLRRVR